MSSAGQAVISDKEAHFFAEILLNTKTAIDVDWAVIAEKAGYNNAATAKTRFSQIKKRLIEKANDGGAGPSTPVKAKSTHAKKSPGSGKKSGSGINTTPFRVTKKTKSSMIGSNDLKDIKEESVHSGNEGDAEDDN